MQLDGSTSYPCGSQGPYARMQLVHGLQIMHTIAWCYQGLTRMGRAINSTLSPAPIADLHDLMLGYVPHRTPLLALRQRSSAFSAAGQIYWLGAK